MNSQPEKNMVTNVPTYYADGFNKINLSPSVTKIQFTLVENDSETTEVSVPVFNLVLSTDAILDLSRRLIAIMDSNKEEYKKLMDEQQRKILGE